MLRTALTPRYLGLLVLVLVVGVVFVQLGRWQLGVAQGSAREEAVDSALRAPTVALTEVLTPHTDFPGELSSRSVSATGHYTEGQLLVPQRRLEGRTGFWVLTPFVVERTGATLPVLRAFVTDPAQAGTPPSGTLTVEGGLAPPESPTDDPGVAGQIGSVDTSVLVNTWPGALYNAFLFLQEESPATGAGLTRVPTPLAPTGLNWRNAAYAVQWWVFALFALWLWWRMVREEHRRAGAGTPAPAGDNGVREHS
ncbi:SURF1 family protein [Phycicoccus endophyticus]|uniref:SURF1-like protein n=1 Tax=Phycicoccus endophyticus TaxID=1690220 RepID=A0A7G9R2M6_9MICO|nr:SURF1 family protein [Phycicoccus endophyticus]NHI20685.1 SURF1 family protein [Phycicoccus endophyticus]QNN49851.1 SURF1 family protein [Phycicoccus endophyticus]GGL35746.1 SURF1-like protein [Phycicoccus endophyticus]